MEACGIRHGDAFVEETGYPGLEHPGVPGHEVETDPHSEVEGEYDRVIGTDSRFRVALEP